MRRESSCLNARYAFISGDAIDSADNILMLLR
jgi:hypothetical protein